MTSNNISTTPGNAHSRWVKVSHWIITISFLFLAISGFFMIMTHPRFYWGEVGNDLTPALFEIPIGPNYQHGGWEESAAFFRQANSPITASRTYDIFNENGWGRSLHFLSAWFLVVTGLVYLVLGIFSRHFRRNLVPDKAELNIRHIRRELSDHIHLRIPPPTGGPHYGLLQKAAYLGIVFFALPLTVFTGLAMSPAISAAFPFVTNVLGGFQSARTIHLFATLALVLFLIIHLIMIIKSGFKQQIRGMTIGK